MSTLSTFAPFKQPGVVFDEAEHRYTYCGQRVLNVTTINREHKISADWSVVPAATLIEKREIGTAAHKASHYADEGDLKPGTVDARVWPYLEAWRLAVRELELEMLLLETVLVHPVRLYGGTLDRLAIAHRLSRNGMPSIVDIKTGDPDDAGAGPQTAAYEQLARANLVEVYEHLEACRGGRGTLPWSVRELNEEAWTRYSVQLLPSGKYKLCTYNDHRDLQRFNMALSLEASAHPSWRRER